MAALAPSQYVSQYWPSLAQLTGQQAAAGMIDPAQVRANKPQLSAFTPELPMREFGKRNIGPQSLATQDVGIQAANLSGQGQAEPQSALPDGATPSTSIGARANPPAPVDAEADGEKVGFWHVAEKLTDAEKAAITKQFEDNGVEIEKEFEELRAEGNVDPGYIKRGKDGKLDKNDMGLFLMEFGLRMAAGGGKKKDFGANLGQATLDTIDNRRRVGSQQREDLRRDELVAYARSRDKRADKEKGLAAVEREQARRDAAAEKRSELETRAAEVKDARAERKADRDARRAESAADRSLRASEGEADRNNRLKVTEAEKAARDKEITDTKVAELTVKRQQALDEGQYMLKINGKPWAQASEAEKKTYLKQYAKEVRETFGSEGSAAAPAWAK